MGKLVGEYVFRVSLWFVCMMVMCGINVGCSKKAALSDRNIENNQELKLETVTEFKESVIEEQAMENGDSASEEIKRGYYETAESKDEKSGKEIDESEPGVRDALVEEPETGTCEVESTGSGLEIREAEGTGSGLEIREVESTVLALGIREVESTATELEICESDIEEPESENCVLPAEDAESYSYETVTLKSEFETGEIVTEESRSIITEVDNKETESETSEDILEVVSESLCGYDACVAAGHIVVTKDSWNEDKTATIYVPYCLNEGIEYPELMYSRPWGCDENHSGEGLYFKIYSKSYTCVSDGYYKKVCALCDSFVFSEHTNAPGNNGDECHLLDDNLKCIWCGRQYQNADENKAWYFEYAVTVKNEEELMTVRTVDNR